MMNTIVTISPNVAPMYPRRAASLMAQPWLHPYMKKAAFVADNWANIKMRNAVAYRFCNARRCSTARVESPVPRA